MKLGLQDWWNKMHFSGTFSHSDILSIRYIKKLVLQALQDKERALQYKSTDSNSRGSFILKSMEAYDDFARWSVNIDFDESILVWHIATEVYIRKSKAKHAKELIEATEILSDYMMFLLVVKPNMLPGAARHNIHLTSCEQQEGQCRACFGDKDNPVAPSPISWNPYCMFKELFHRDGPNCSRIPRREKLAEMAWSFSQFALVWAECGASSSFIFCLKSISPFLEKMTQALPHCLQFQFAGIPSMPIQLKRILLVNMFDNIKDLKQVSIFILAGFTSRTSTCLYSELHLKAVLFEFRNVQLNFVS